MKFLGIIVGLIMVIIVVFLGYATHVRHQKHLQDMRELDEIIRQQDTLRVHLDSTRIRLGRTLKEIRESKIDG